MLSHIKIYSFHLKHYWALFWKFGQTHPTRINQYLSQTQPETETVKVNQARNENN